jgi:hypothetical protein
VRWVWVPYPIRRAATRTGFCVITHPVVAGLRGLSMQETSLTGLPKSGLQGGTHGVFRNRLPMGPEQFRFCQLFGSPTEPEYGSSRTVTLVISGLTGPLILISAIPTDGEVAPIS